MVHLPLPTSVPPEVLIDQRPLPVHGGGGPVIVPVTVIVWSPEVPLAVNVRGLTVGIVPAVENPSITRPVPVPAASSASTAVHVTDVPLSLTVAVVLMVVGEMPVNRPVTVAASGPHPTNAGGGGAGAGPGQAGRSARASASTPVLRREPILLFTSTSIYA